MILALELGMTLSEIGQRMSAAELAAWMAFNRINPIGEIRGDLRSAMTRHQVAEMHRDRKRHPEPFPLEDFMPNFRGEKRKKRTGVSLSGGDVAKKLKSIFGRGK